MWRIDKGDEDELQANRESGRRVAVRWSGSYAGDGAVGRAVQWPATIEGTAAGEVLRGTSGPDRIAAGAGNDIVRAYAGRDVVCGDSGRDRLPGGGARDLLYGGADQDELLGRDGNDRLYGGIVDGDSSFDDGQQDLMEPGIGYDDCRLDPDDGAYNCDVSSGETH